VELASHVIFFEKVLPHIQLSIGKLWQYNFVLNS